MKKALSLALVLVLLVSMMATTLVSAGNDKGNGNSGAGVTNSSNDGSKVLGGSLATESIVIAKVNKDWVISNNSDVCLSVSYRYQISSKYDVATIVVAAGELNKFLGAATGKDSINNIWLNGSAPADCSGNVTENGWVVTTEPTCTEEGVESQKCSVEKCTTVLTRPVDALGHDLSTVRVEATYEAAGSITTTCSRGDYNDVVVLPQLVKTEPDPCCTDGKCIECVLKGLDKKITNINNDQDKKWEDIGISSCVYGSQNGEDDFTITITDEFTKYFVSITIEYHNVKVTYTSAGTYKIPVQSGQGNAEIVAWVLR